MDENKLFCETTLLWLIDWKKKRQENSIFWSTHFLKAASLDDLILSNWIILVEELIRWKESFKIFLIDHYAGDIGNINIAGKY